MSKGKFGSSYLQLQFPKLHRPIINSYTLWPLKADFSGHAVKRVSCRWFACWDCGFESRWRHGRPSLEGVTYC